jgi:anti-sigma-K factor RskA
MPLSSGRQGTCSASHQSATVGAQRSLAVWRVTPRGEPISSQGHVPLAPLDDRQLEVRACGPEDAGSLLDHRSPA